jgi:hypothetical protein
MALKLVAQVNDTQERTKKNILPMIFVGSFKAKFEGL